MASIFNKRGKYWLKYHDPESGQWKIKPTPLIYPQDARKAKQLKAETTAAELRQGAHKIPQAQRWESWVLPYMMTRYGADSSTYRRYYSTWTHLSAFLQQMKPPVNSPSGWKAEYNALYVDWKSATTRTKTGSHAAKQKIYRSRNVAIWDLGVLSMLMNEAKRRGYITENKVSRARIRKGERTEKPALTDEQIGILRKSLSHPQRRNMAIAFEIGLYTGCRLAETSISFDRIDFKRGTITFIPKGAKNNEGRIFTAPIINAEFKAWLEKVVEERRVAGHTTTCDIHRTTSFQFGRICRKLGLKGPKGEKITFHCLRVNFVTRSYEAGLSGEVVRKFVGHSDVLINRLYQRMSIEGLQELGAKLQMPSAISPVAR